MRPSRMRPTSRSSSSCIQAERQTYSARTMEQEFLTHRRGWKASQPTQYTTFASLSHASLPRSHRKNVGVGLLQHASSCCSLWRDTTSLSSRRGALVLRFAPSTCCRLESGLRLTAAAIQDVFDDMMPPHSFTYPGPCSHPTTAALVTRERHSPTSKSHVGKSCKCAVDVGRGLPQKGQRDVDFPSSLSPCDPDPAVRWAVGPLRCEPVRPRRKGK